MVSLRRHFVPNPVPSSETRFALRSKSPLFLHTRYDAEGNRASRTRTSSAQADDYTAIYTWDHRNRLTSATFEDNSGSVNETVTYTYDAFNRWIGEVVTAGGTTTRTQFVYEGNQIVLQFDMTGTGDAAASDLSHRYLWGPAVDQLLSDEQLQGTPQFVCTLGDNLNTVRDLAVHSGGVTSVVNHRVFSAYGELLSQTAAQSGQAATVDCLFAYTGRPLDATTGLQNNLNRWYDAATGRWLSQDPIGYKGGINLYEYVGDAPPTRTDPLGMWKVCCATITQWTTADYWLFKVKIPSWWTHCELKQNCSSDETGYSVETDTSHSRTMLIGGKCCDKVTESDIATCIQNSDAKGGWQPVAGRPYGWGNNSNTTAIYELGRCCLKSSWVPPVYAGPRQGRCLVGHLTSGDPIGGPPQLICDEWELPQWW